MADNYKIKIVKKPDVTDLVGEKVMIDFESGKYFMLTGSANDIWDMMDDGVETEGIVKGLLEIYEVETGECRDSVMRFLKEIEQLGFVSLEKCD